MDGLIAGLILFGLVPVWLVILPILLLEFLLHEMEMRDLKRKAIERITEDLLAFQMNLLVPEDIPGNVNGDVLGWDFGVEYINGRPIDNTDPHYYDPSYNSDDGFSLGHEADVPETK